MSSSIQKVVREPNGSLTTQILIKEMKKQCTKI